MCTTSQSKVPCAKDWSNDKAAKWRREKPYQKYFQTVKKNHQITHMKIICTAVEETHTIYGQANFWYLFSCSLIISSNNSLPNFEANNTLWCTTWNWSRLESSIVGIGILHLAKRLCWLQHQYNLYYTHLAFIVELPARLFRLPRLEEKEITQHPGNVQRTYSVNYTFWCLIAKMAPTIFISQ